jgi:hypothetical protein
MQDAMNKAASTTIKSRLAILISASVSDHPRLTALGRISRERLKRKAHSAVIRARTCSGKRDPRHLRGARSNSIQIQVRPQPMHTAFTSIPAFLVPTEG